jgi:transposase-like protein
MNDSCPQCTSKAFKRNGFTRHGKQNHRCLDCGRQFSMEPKLDAVESKCSEPFPNNLIVAVTLNSQNLG